MAYRDIWNLILEKGIFPIGDALLGSRFILYKKKYKKYENASEEELNEILEEKLRNILKHACSNTRYYAGFSNRISDDIFQSIKKFPILTKDLLRRESDNLLTRPKSECVLYETSGSSGISTRVFIDKKEQSVLRAILVNWWEWTGFYLGKPIFQTGMNTRRGPIKFLKDKLTRTFYINAFNLTETQILEHLKRVEGRKNYHLGGYASSLFVIAQIAEKHNLNITFDAAISWGDKLFPHYQKKIEKVFKTKVFENYSCNEGIMIGQKVDLPYFYIYTPNVFVEILDREGNEVADGEMGRVIVTKLDGYAMPLIRYETGDFAVKLPRNKYPVKRKFNFPLLESVIGRDTDMIKTRDGNTLIVHTFTGIFEYFPAIRQFRVIQNDMDSIDIEYIPDEDFTQEVLKRIEDLFRMNTKSDIMINWMEVSYIPPTKSGKPQIIQNNLISKQS